MMMFSYEEILCMNSITDGPKPFRIRLIKAPGSEESILMRAQVGLREKNILDKDNHLTMAGKVMIRCYELYRNCKDFAVINEVSVAFVAKRECIICYPVAGGYMMECMDRMKVAAAILKESPYLQRIKKVEAEERGAWSDAGYEEVMAFVEKEAKGHLLISEIAGTDARKGRLFYWTDTKGYIYNLEQERLKAAGPREMWKEVLRVLKLWDFREELKQEIELKQKKER
jgi:hypothetical protein